MAVSDAPKRQDGKAVNERVKGVICPPSIACLSLPGEVSS
jgi:hypothetical protein